VTDADRANEELIVRLVTEHFPEDGLLGEEGSARPARSGRQWIIDPIDGTRDYLRGLPGWAVLIGFESAGEVAAGVCYLPVLQEMYYASRGGGAWLETPSRTERLRASSISEVSRALLCMVDFDRVARLPFASGLVDFLARFWAVRNLGGILDLMLVASGHAEACLEPGAKPWDLAAPQIILEEAGARFRNFDGGRSIYGGNCLACAPALEAELLRFVGTAAAVSR
jgi:fructose-1,6-bisphosphatase/inositol monophosphatase family enzyme